MVYHLLFWIVLILIFITNRKVQLYIFYKIELYVNELQEKLPLNVSIDTFLIKEKDKLDKNTR